MIRSDSHLSAVQELLERLVIAVIGYCKTASQIQSHHAKKRFGIHNVAALAIIGNVNVKITVLCSVYKVLNITGAQINILGCSHRIPPSSQKARPFFVLFFVSFLVKHITYLLYVGNYYNGPFPNVNWWN